MSYDFSFEQFPTKEFDELLVSFLKGTLSEEIKKHITELEKEQEAIKVRQEVRPQGTWETHRDEWMQWRKDGDKSIQNRNHIDDWKQLQKTMTAHKQDLENAKTTKEKEGIIKKVIEEFLPLFGKQNPYTPRILFIETCESFSDSARSNTYFFLVQLFSAVHKRNLDTTKNMPTLTEWHELFQALKSEFFEKEFSVFCKKNAITESERARTKQECLELLFAIKDLVKSSLEKDWDLWFTSDWQNTDLEKKQMKVLAKKCQNTLESYIDAKASSK